MAVNVMRLKSTNVKYMKQVPEDAARSLICMYSMYYSSEIYSKWAFWFVLLQAESQYEGVDRLPFVPCWKGPGCPGKFIILTLSQYNSITV